MNEYLNLNLLEYFPLSRKAHILDFGCGDGAVTDWVRLKYPFVTAFDPVPNGRCETGDPKAFLTRNRNRFDAILAKQVIYYFPRLEIDEYFRCLHDALKPDGQLVIEIFNGTALSAAWIFDKDHGMQTVFNEISLRNALERAGFSIVALRCERYPKRGWKRQVWLTARAAWFAALRVVYVLERGMDEQNPKLFGKNLIAVARRD